MLDNQNDEQKESRSMHHREITLADGRYMIFYTFDDAESADKDTEGTLATTENDTDV